MGVVSPGDVPLTANLSLQWLMATRCVLCLWRKTERWQKSSSLVIACWIILQALFGSGRYAYTGSYWDIYFPGCSKLPGECRTMGHIVKQKGFHIR
jgi:hypothetical protein